MLKFLPKLAKLESISNGGLKMDLQTQKKIFQFLPRPLQN
jgi:hypothetical protein